MHGEPPQELDADSFGDLLRQRRLAANLTQGILAERAGLSVRGISDLERGARAYPYRQTLHLLADALALTGAERGPELWTVIAALPQDEALRRVDAAL